MRVRSASLLAVLLATTALGPVVLGAGIPAEGGPTTLYLRSLQAPLGSLGPVLTLSDEPPVATNSTPQNLSAGVAWYAVPVAAREFTIGDVNGVLTFQVVGRDLPLLGVTFQAQLSYELRKVANNGSVSVLGNASSSFEARFSAIDALAGSPVPSGPVNQTFTIAAPANVTLAPGETLGLNVTGIATVPSAPAPPPVTTGEVQLLYDSTLHPGSISTTLDPVARGNVQLSATSPSRDAAPGSSPTYTLTVRNLASEADTVRLNATGEPASWTVRLTPSQTNVPAGSSVSVLVTVVVPGDAAEGMRHTANVTGQSSLGGARASLVFTTTVRASPIATGDADGDGWTDVEERRYGSSPNDRNSTPDNTDSDRDGASNRAEIDQGTDPFDANDFPGSGAPGGTPYAGLFGGLTDYVAQSTGFDRATSDLLIIAAVLLFLIILALLVLLLRGYPVKVALVEARATTEPGRPVDYSVQLRSRRREPQVVDLEVAELPGDWDARLTEPHVSLDPKATHTVGLLVRPPDGWPAPSQREFQVRARSRLKPSRVARAIGRLFVQPGTGAPAPVPVEEGVPEPQAWPGEPEAVGAAAAAGAAASEAAYAPPRAGAPFRVAIRDVKHTPDVPQRGGEVTTTARVENLARQPERVRLVLVVNGKVRDEAQTELAPGEGAEAEFHWVAYLARNEVRVVAERA